jgi:uncharacterized membrane protein
LSKKHLKNISKKKGPANSQVVDLIPPPGELLEIQQTSFSGPLPPPHILAEYKQVVPGLADVLIENWTKEVNHRHSMETKALEENREVNKRSHGMFISENRFRYFKTACSFFLVLSALGGTLYFANQIGKETAFVTAIIEALGLVGLFMKYSPKQLSGDKKRG